MLIVIGVGKIFISSVRIDGARSTIERIKWVAPASVAWSRMTVRITGLMKRLEYDRYSSRQPCHLSVCRPGNKLMRLVDAEKLETDQVLLVEIQGDSPDKVRVFQESVPIVQTRWLAHGLLFETISE